MNLYIETNIKIVNIIRRYVSDDDIHVYSIDELFVRFDKVKTSTEIVVLNNSQKP